MTGAISAEPATSLSTYIAQHRGETLEAPMLARLREEHRHLASVLALLSDHLDAIERGDLASPRVVSEIMNYMLVWPDRFHHPREDLIVEFAANRGPGLGELELRQVAGEHDRLARQGRDVLACVQRWRAGEGGGDLVTQGRAYVRDSYAHMAYEEQALFPALDAALTREDWRELAADDQLKLEKDPVFGRRVSREFRTMARKLRRSLRRGLERRAVADWVGLEAAMEGVDVLSMTLQSGRVLTREQLRLGFRDTLRIFRESPSRAPLRCTINNAWLTLQWVEEMSGICRDAASDLMRVNQERRDRLRLLKRAGEA